MTHTRSTAASHDYPDVERERAPDFVPAGDRRAGTLGLDFEPVDIEPDLDKIEEQDEPVAAEAKRIS